MKKRLWAVLLAAAVMTTAVPVLPQDTALAVQAATKPSGKEVADTSEDGVVTAGGYTFTVDGINATITGYVGTSKDLTIPTKISVKTTTTEDTQKKVGAGTTTTTDYNVTSIAASAFSGQLGIQSVTMQGGTNSSGQLYGITSIGERAFFACQQLSKITIAATTSYIGENAFADCVALNSIAVTEGNKNYTVIDNALYSYSVASGTGGYTLVQYPLANAATSYAVPMSIATTLTGIGSGAFWGAPNLDTITIPSTVKTIGADAFAECKQLKTIALPDGLTALGAEAFQGCSSLTDIIVPQGVKTIGNGTFENCALLKNISLPDTVTMIGSHAFSGCSSLTEFVVPASNTMLGDGAFANCAGLYKITIPTKTTSFGTGVFAGTNVTVYCHSGSQAYNYARNNRLPIQATYTVSFYTDSTYSKLISSQEVTQGGSATPPAMDNREGYQLSWSGSYTDITSDLKLYATWQKMYTVTFIDDYNNRSTTQEVAAGKYATVPSWRMSGYTLYWDASVNTAVNRDITAHAVWKSDTTGFEIDRTTVRPKKKGTSLVKGNNKYQVTSANVERPTVKFTGVSGSASSVVIPSSVTIGNVTYSVTAIASDAMKGNRSVTGVTIGSRVKLIGSKAFYGCSKLKKIKINSKGVSKIYAHAFGKIRSGARFYCYTSKMSKYRILLKKSGMKKPVVSRL